MSLQYIIDGYNIINHSLFAHTHKRIENPQKTLLEFIKIKRLCGSPKNKIIVVFDGYSDTMSESKQNDNKINVIFSKKETADEKIKKIVEAHPNPKDIIVVSDDKEIMFFVKATGSRCIHVEEFINPRKNLPGFPKEDSYKPELTYSQAQRINQELKKIWLK